MALTVKELITQLLDQPMDDKVVVLVRFYDERMEDEERCIDGITADTTYWTTALELDNRV